MKQALAMLVFLGSLSAGCFVWQAMIAEEVAAEEAAFVAAGGTLGYTCGTPQTLGQELLGYCGLGLGILSVVTYFVMVYWISKDDETWTPASRSVLTLGSGGSAGSAQGPSPDKVQ